MKIIPGSITAIVILLITQSSLFSAQQKYLSTDELKAIQATLKQNGINVPIVAADDIDAVDAQGNTALMLAAKAEKNDLVDMLLDKGANINRQNRDGETALILTIKNNNPKLAMELVGKGADVNLSDEKDNTPLMLAVSKNYPEMIDLLIGRGADIDEKNKNKETALILALKEGRDKIARKLIEQGANVDYEDDRGNTPLSLAIMKDYPEVVDALIKHGVDVNIKIDGETPLTFAIKEGKTTLAVDLIEKGKANVDAINNLGNSPLINAVVFEQPEIVDLLVSKNADVNHKNNRDKTAKDYAEMIIVHKNEILKSLKNKNAKTSSELRTEQYETKGKS